MIGPMTGVEDEDLHLLYLVTLETGGNAVSSG